MNNFRFLLAAVVALSAGAWFLSHQETQKFSGDDKALLLPDLAARLGDISEVRIAAAGSAPVTLKQADGQWAVVERDDFPAETEVLRRELRKLADAHIQEAKTSQAGYYERLGVQDVDLATNTTMQVTASTAEGPVVDLLIGKTGQGGSYVRKVGETQSWLLDASITLPRGVETWLAKDIVDIQRTDLARIDVNPATGPAYSLSKSDKEQTDFTLTPAAPKGRELNFANLNRLGAALSRLRLMDVMSVTPEDLTWTTARFQRFDGLILDLTMAKNDSDRLLKLAASMSPDTAESSEELKTEVERINTLAVNRVFKVAQHPVDAMSMTHENMLKPLPSEPAK